MKISYNEILKVMDIINTKGIDLEKTYKPLVAYKIKNNLDLIEKNYYQVSRELTEKFPDEELTGQAFIEYRNYLYDNFIDIPIQEISFIDVSERPLTLREMEYLYVMFEDTDETNWLLLSLLSSLFLSW